MTPQIGIRADVKEASGVDDLFSDYHRCFTTAVGALEDGVAPRIAAQSLIDGARQVGINNRVSIRCDEAVSPLGFLGEEGGLPLAKGPNSDARSYSRIFSDGNRQVDHLPHGGQRRHSDDR